MSDSQDLNSERQIDGATNSSSRARVSFGAEQLQVLSVKAEEFGLHRLGVVSLDHPGFEPARRRLAEFLEQGQEGEMAFMRRYAELRSHPEKMLDGAKSMLIACMPYRGEAGPVARYAQSQDYHRVGYRRLMAFDEYLKEALPGVQTLACVDTKPVMERAAAMLAGLGFIGKHGCLIVPGLGSYVLLAGLLCTAEWTGPDMQWSRSQSEEKLRRPESTLPWDACGSCRLCLDACPTDAFDAPGVLEPRRCIAYLSIEHRGPIEDRFAEQFGERVAGCDLCQEVCPYNRSEKEEDQGRLIQWLPPTETPRDSNPANLANIGSAAYRRFVKGTAIDRIPRKALRRNALVALGNRTVALAASEQAELLKAMEDSDPEIQRVAHWAWQRRHAGRSSK